MVGTGDPMCGKIRHSKRSYLGYRSYINQQDRLLRSHIDILEIRWLGQEIPCVARFVIAKEVI